MRKTKTTSKARRLSVENGRRGGVITKRLIIYGRRYVEQHKIDLNRPLKTS